MPRIDNRVRFTKALIEAIGPAARERWLWDQEVRRLGLRCYPNGRKMFVYQYAVGGRTHRMALGEYGVELTVERARERAAELRQQVRRGGDPVGDDQAARARQTAAERVRATEEEQARREADVATQRAETLSAFVVRYMAHAEGHKKASSLRNDRSLLREHIEPALGDRPVADITRAEVMRLHQSLRATPYVANRMLALLSTLLNTAEQWDLRALASNPCRHVKRFREAKRQRFLSSAELGRLGAVLAEVEREGEEHFTIVPAVRLLLLTGARRGEILGLRWEHVVWERRCLELPDSKTGAKTIFLNPPALEVLEALYALRTEGNPWVLPGRHQGKGLVGLPHAWLRLRKRAGLDGSDGTPAVRLHDLRHSFASVAAARGASLPIIGALLGHTQPATTARYAHLAADPLREAVASIGERIAAAISPENQPAEVVPMRRARQG